uniref:Uncharacterized protein LOC102809902 n=1 Tax=Saccoglossus kowalevskii TaxID=10224 RepID=A0ABM0M2Q5_SACKO|nr:PREDICTED: uncharacterized protein LOC102809902 [Saccoglossus kowalevskii]
MGYDILCYTCLNQQFVVTNVGVWVKRKEGEEHLPPYISGNIKWILPMPYYENKSNMSSDEEDVTSSIISSEPLKVAMWTVALVTVFGNAALLVVRQFLKKDTPSYAVLFTALSAFHFLMGTYIAIVVSLDLYSTHGGILNDEWDNVCIFLGFLVSFAFQMALAVVSTIAISLFMQQLFPRKLKRGKNYAGLFRIIVLVEVACIALLSALPYTSLPYFSDVETQSHVFCLRIFFPSSSVWTYSAFILASTSITEWNVHNLTERGMLKFFHPSRAKFWENEIKVLLKMSATRQHPNITEYLWHSDSDHTVVRDCPASTWCHLAYHTRYISTVSYKHGSLRSFLINHKSNISDANIHMIANQVTDGLRYLHEIGIVHNDVTATNILIGGVVQTMVLKVVISDFTKSLDTSSCFNSSVPDLHQRRTIAMPHIPDVKRRAPSCGNTNFFVDIRSFALVLFEMLAWLQHSKLHCSPVKTLPQQSKNSNQKVIYNTPAGQVSYNLPVKPNNESDKHLCPIQSKKLFEQIHRLSVSNTAIMQTPSSMSSYSGVSQCSSSTPKLIRFTEKTNITTKAIATRPLTSQAPELENVLTVQQASHENQMDTTTDRESPSKFRHSPGSPFKAIPTKYNNFVYSPSTPNMELVADLERTCDQSEDDFEVCGTGNVTLKEDVMTNHSWKNESKVSKTTKAIGKRIYTEAWLQDSVQSVKHCDAMIPAENKELGNQDRILVLSPDSKVYYEYETDENRSTIESVASSSFITSPQREYIDFGRKSDMNVLHELHEEPNHLYLARTSRHLSRFQRIRQKSQTMMNGAGRMAEPDLIEQLPNCLGGVDDADSGTETMTGCENPVFSAAEETDDLDESSSFQKMKIVNQKMFFKTVEIPSVDKVIGFGDVSNTVVKPEVATISTANKQLVETQDKCNDKCKRFSQSDSVSSADSGFSSRHTSESSCPPSKPSALYRQAPINGNRRLNLAQRMQKFASARKKKKRAQASPFHFKNTPGSRDTIYATNADLNVPFQTYSVLKQVLETGTVTPVPSQKSEPEIPEKLDTKKQETTYTHVSVPDKQQIHYVKIPVTSVEAVNQQEEDRPQSSLSKFYVKRTSAKPLAKRLAPQPPSTKIELKAGAAAVATTTVKQTPLSSSDSTNTNKSIISTNRPSSGKLKVEPVPILVKPTSIVTERTFNMRDISNIKPRNYLYAPYLNACLYHQTQIPSNQKLTSRILSQVQPNQKQIR